jgi:hypothetical protein
MSIPAAFFFFFCVLFRSVLFALREVLQRPLSDDRVGRLLRRIFALLSPLRSFSVVADERCSSFSLGGGGGVSLSLSLASATESVITPSPGGNCCSSLTSRQHREKKHE